jgi:hypothetical protein
MKFFGELKFFFVFTYMVKKESENRGTLIIGKFSNYFFFCLKNVQKFKELCIYFYIDFV